MGRKRAAGVPGEALIYGEAFAFTEARVEAARRATAAGLMTTDSAGRRTWRDTECRGLALVVNENTGTATYYWQGTVNGRTSRRSLGTVDAVRLAEAREAIGRLRFDRSLAGVVVPRPRASKADEPRDTTPVVKGVLDGMIEAHAAGRWLPGNRSRRPTDRTMQFYRDLRRAVMADPTTGEDFEALTLQAFADSLPEIHAALAARAPVQANRAVQLWRNLFAFAIDSGSWTAANPAATGKADRLAKATEQPRQRVLTDAEWRRLDAAMTADDPLWRHLFAFSVLTLQRMGAVCRARWADVTLTGDAAAWVIPAADMKGRRTGHVVPLAKIPEALELLRERRKLVPKSCPWIFPAAEGDGGHARNYDKAWERIIRRADLWHEDRTRRPRPHDLRRTGGSRMVSAGVPLNVVTRALGDAPSSVAMVAQTYAVVVDAALADAYGAVAKRQTRRK